MWKLRNFPFTIKTKTRQNGICTSWYVLCNLVSVSISRNLCEKIARIYFFVLLNVHIYLQIEKSWFYGIFVNAPEITMFRHVLKVFSRKIIHFSNKFIVSFNTQVLHIITYIVAERPLERLLWLLETIWLRTGVYGIICPRFCWWATWDLIDSMEKWKKPYLLFKMMWAQWLTFTV